MDVVKTWEQWATAHEQEWHREALMTYGERVVYRLSWKPEDAAAGLVERCRDCHIGETASVQERYRDMYNQAGESRCMTCYGTGYVGGFTDAVYVGFILAVDDPDARARTTTGSEIYEQPSTQFLWYPKVLPGDMVVRVREWIDEVTPAVEEHRYVVGASSPQSVRTGPRIGNDDSIVVAWTAQIRSLPDDHIYYEVPLG